MNNQYYLAIDLGATSGRTILGSFSESGLTMKELNRFPNHIVKVGDHFCWNLFSLYEHILEGLRKASEENVHITSIGIDTWGVDFVCVGKDGNILGLPYAYRDGHTENAPEQFFKQVMPASELYAKTGIQIMNFNSVFQLFAMKRDSSSALQAADRLLFIPDALSYLLTGNFVTEYTIASTAQLVDPHTKQIDPSLMESLGLDPALFGKVVMPGTKVGKLKAEIAHACGLEEDIPVVAVAGHDTGSAVAAVPALEKGFAYLSSGTWSLMGIEKDGPVINDYTFNANFTNEGGVDGTIRLLKNITGMWILENCMNEWKAQGQAYTYPEIVAMAGTSPRFTSLIDPDAPVFANPVSMTEAIKTYCSETHQAVPSTHEEFVCCIFESLALKYRVVLEKLQELSDERIQVLHVIGGGARNGLLNQYIANSIQMKVVAGPSEATAIGNIMVQAKSTGAGQSLMEMRKTVADSIPLNTYLPADAGLWNENYKKYLNIINK